MKDQNWRVRFVAVEKLGQMGTSEMVPYLIQSLLDPEWRIQAKALKELAQVEPKVRNGAQKALELRDDGSYYIRSFSDIAGVLTPIAEVAIPALTQVLYDKEAYVRRQKAVELLEQMELPEARSALQKHRTDELEAMHKMLTAEPGSLIGIYVDPKTGTELVLYKVKEELAGTWTSRASLAEQLEMRGAPRGDGLMVQPLAHIVLRANGALIFEVLWDMYFRGEGKRVMRHYFNGQLTGEALSGEFRSDWSVLRPPPLRAVKRIPPEPQKDREHLLSRREKAQGYVARIQNLLRCQDARHQLPQEPLDVVGVWSNQESDGEHEWGYEVALFKVGGTYHGWYEDYSGLIGDGGTRHLIRNITHDNGHKEFRFDGGHLVVMEGTALFNDQRLVKGALPSPVWGRLSEKESIWRLYQELRSPCEE